ERKELLVCNGPLFGQGCIPSMRKTGPRLKIPGGEALQLSTENGRRAAGAAAHRSVEFDSAERCLSFERHWPASLAQPSERFLAPVRIGIIRDGTGVQELALFEKQHATAQPRQLVSGGASSHAGSNDDHVPLFLFGVARNVISYLHGALCVRGTLGYTIA